MTVADDFPPKDLTKEKSLLQIYIASRRIKGSWFNGFTTFLVVLLLCVHAWLSPQPIDDTLAAVRGAADWGFSLSLSTLGLLIAGFTIFATISQPGLSIEMSRVRHPESGLSWLKHNYFIFLRVFIYYIVYSALCLSIIAFGGKDGLVPLLASYSPYEDHVKFTLTKVFYVILYSGQYFLLMQLKSFTFNIYHSVMTALRWKAEGYD